jgi:flavin reductase (DIM6/NTAB) family NADH-FMN oxidoreductase RutF
VVTATGRHGPHGVTVNAFTSLSLDPPMILVCLDATGRSAEILADAGHFAVNILATGQSRVATWFASKQRPAGAAGFLEVPHRRGVTGAPLLTGAAAHLDCVLNRWVPAGDHVIFIGTVVDLSVPRPDAAALAFYQGRMYAIDRSMERR